MAGKFARSWELTKQAWAVLKEDKRLLVFPLISGTLTVVLVAGSIGGIIAAFAISGVDDKAKIEETAKQYQFVFYPALFLLYMVVHFVITFFQAALLSCAITKFNGGTPTIGGGLKAAASKIPQILGWSIINATVGVALNALKEKAGFLGQLFLGVASLAWNIATFFVVPALVIEGIGPIAAIKQSTSVIKKTWGETLITQVGFGTAVSLIGLLLFLLILGAGIGLSVAFHAPVFALLGFLLAVGVLLVGGVVQSAMKTLLIAATYRYAAEGAASGPFSGELLQGMFRPKK